MQITIKGELSIPELRQTLYETLHELEETLAVRYSLGATLYVNPTNGFGDAVVPHDKHGTAVKKLLSRGPYRSAADEYKV
ncbi:hypothetical protein AB4156_32445 [Cupriavidus sp. 2MCAB6]|uniref:hypothetical protein n=1 Tax=Cupriavidus sp. 2MCAB6 TaxID=3232981 RepID=UPI003F8E34DD